MALETVEVDMDYFSGSKCLLSSSAALGAKAKAYIWTKRVLFLRVWAAEKCKQSLSSAFNSKHH